MMIPVTPKIPTMPSPIILRTSITAEASISPRLLKKATKSAAKSEKNVPKKPDDSAAISITSEIASPETSYVI